MKQTIVHVIADISKDVGGPSRSVTGLCNGLSSKENQIHLFTLIPSSPLRIPHSITMHTFPCWGPRRLALSPALHKALMSFLSKNKDTLLHSHALWNGVSATAAMVSKRTLTPHIISPRGMLEPWTLKYSSLKKQIVRKVFQDKALNSAKCLHATALSEAESFRQFGLKNPIAVVPNGIDVEEFQSIPPFSVLQRFNLIKDQRPYILFLSRIHPKKGLINLVSAWHKIHKKYRDHLLVIAGPDEVNHTEYLKQLVHKLHLEEQTVFLGPVYGEQRLALLAYALLLVLPSFSENFGIVVAESLASRTPVITTEATPWKDLSLFHCGWWIKLGVDPLSETLDSALSLSEKTLQEMGLNGFRLVKEKYDWKKIAQQMNRVYQWLLGGGPPPDVVIGGL